MPVRRIAEAKLPRIKRLAEFTLDFVPSITPAQLAHRDCRAASWAALTTPG